MCMVFHFLFCHFCMVLIFLEQNVDFLKILYKQYNKSFFSSQVLQIALQSCVNQLNAGRPEEAASLPSVHLAYHHFRSRLQNFSRILTIHPPILPSLMKGTQNQNWAGREMVWPLLGISHACSRLGLLKRVWREGRSHHLPDKGKLMGLVPTGRHLYQHTCQCGFSVRIHPTHAP